MREVEEARKLEEARRACQRTLRLGAKHLEAQVRLGNIHMSQGQWQDAEGLFRQVLATEPGQTDAQIALANCLMKQGDLENAKQCLEKILEGDPRNLAAHDLLIQVHFQQNNPSKAHQEHLRRALLLDGVSGAKALLEVAQVSLLYGEMPLGWDQFEARFLLPGLVLPSRDFPEPRWNGEPFPGRTLLLLCEQGFGDTLMFVRYAPMVKALGGRVVLTAQAPLADLVATCAGIDEIIPTGRPLPTFDLYLPLLSLPRIFRTDLTSIPADIPYLRVPDAVPNRGELEALLARSEGCIRIGVAWKGSSSYTRDAERSIPPSTLAPLAALPQVAWHSFQFEEGEELPSLPGILTPGALLKGFSNTAFAISRMDLVITVDTVVAHLAGALGIPTLLLVSYSPDFRWMLERDDSPWYPTLRIYRQPSAGDWESVIQQVLGDLANQE
jgi:hypothetical protein